MSCGRKPSDEALCSQPTMTRLENNVGSRTLYKIGKLFLDEYISSFDKAPKKVVIDADDTNANTYGGQQLTLFNAYYNEYCYMPLMLFDGLTGKLMLPLLRPGRRNKSQNVARIMARVVEYLHGRWPQTVIELRGDSHFCSHEFMDWAHDKWYVRYLTGLSGNSVLLAMVDKPRRRAEHDYKKKAEAQKRDNEAKRAAGRMSCNSYRANYFRLYLHSAAFVIAHRMKRTVFKGTEVERFTMDSIVRRIMLSAVHVVEKKTFIKISFSPHHRHLEEVVGALTRMAG